MSDQSTLGSAPTLEVVQGELLRGIERAVSDFMLNNGTVPMEQSAKAALDFAQAYVILNPTMDSNGIPLQHEKDMANLNAAHAAQAAAAKPSPAKGAKP